MLRNTPTASGNAADERTWQTLVELNLPAAPGDERPALTHVAQVGHNLNLPATQLERLKASVTQALLDARERHTVPVSIRVQTSHPAAHHPAPARSWGFFLIEGLIDGRPATGDESRYTIDVFLYLENDQPLRLEKRNEP